MLLLENGYYGIVTQSLKKRLTKCIQPMHETTRKEHSTELCTRLALGGPLQTWKWIMLSNGCENDYRFFWMLMPAPLLISVESVICWTNLNTEDEWTGRQNVRQWVNHKIDEEIWERQHIGAWTIRERTNAWWRGAVDNDSDLPGTQLMWQLN